MERTLEALRRGNGPRKAYENLCRGNQDSESVARSILHYYGEDTNRWQEVFEYVLGALSTFDAEEKAASS